MSPSSRPCKIMEVHNHYAHPSMLHHNKVLLSSYIVTHNETDYGF